MRAAAPSLDIGLALPQRGGTGDWATIETWARRAEAAGLSSVWLSDLPGDAAAADPLTALAGLAAVTHTVRLGALFLDSALRPPGVTAKALASVDALSSGRLTVGLVPGGSTAEGLSEAIQVMRGAFSGEPFSFEGRHHRADGLRCLPRPVQRPAPPLWVGGGDAALLAVAALHADGWNPGTWSASTSEYSILASRLDAACREAGRAPSTVGRSVNLHVLVGEDERDVARRWERLCRLIPLPARPGRSLHEYAQGALVGTVEQVREQVAGWAALGVTGLVVSLAEQPFGAASVDDLALAASALV